MVGRVTALEKRSLCKQRKANTKVEESRGREENGFWKGLLAQLDFGSGGNKSLNYIKIDLRKNQ